MDAGPALKQHRVNVTPTLLDQKALMGSFPNSDIERGSIYIPGMHMGPLSILGNTIWE